MEGLSGARDPTKRFSERVNDYVKYRPSYPLESLAVVRKELADAKVIADIGSGTGIFSELLLKVIYDGEVPAKTSIKKNLIGIEPNKEMREAGETMLKPWIEVGAFQSLDATAEQTTLPDHSVDVISVAQAFHWFRPKESHIEFNRILKPGGLVILIWNERLVSQINSEFMIEHEVLMKKYAAEYEKVHYKNLVDETRFNMFFTGGFKIHSCDNHQLFDLEGLKGRVESSSYCPAKGDPNYDPLIKGLESLFEKNQKDGKIRFDYTTNLYYGHFAQ